MAVAGDGNSASEPVARYLAARIADGGWLLDREPRGAGPEMALALQALDALRALPADEQRARVATLRDAERSCAADDRLDLLTGSLGTR